MKSPTSSHNSKFSRIYVEKDVLNTARAQNVLSQFPNAVVVQIEHYKDVFCRPRQSFSAQKNSPQLILAHKKNDSAQGCLYESSENCQSFGYSNFYYISQIQNCIFDCEYCYLQGLYPSANIVFFLNTEHYFEEINGKQLYICISYDTDILAFEHITGFAAEWIEFLREQSGITVEIRTKTATVLSCNAVDNVILAWSVLPQPIISKYEVNTPSLNSRLKAIKKNMENGFKVRLCIDPIIIDDNFEVVYADFIEQIFSEINASAVNDVSIGVFRMTKEHLKKARRGRAGSEVLHYPYSYYNSTYTYSKEDYDKLMSFVYKLVLQKVGKDKIFII